MNRHITDNLADELSILGKKAVLSMSARQRVRDNLFKKMGQLDLIDAVQTKTEVEGLIMPLTTLLSIFKPQRVSFGLPATAGIALGLAALTFATGAMAQNAEPGSLFYTVRRAIEDVQVALEPSAVERANKRIEIATERIAIATSAISTNPAAEAKKIAPVIEATKQAVAQAKVAVDAAQQEDSSQKSAETLSARLQTTLEQQVEQLEEIAEEYKDNQGVTESIAAVNAELTNMLASINPEEPKAGDTPTEKPAVPTDTPAVNPATTPSTGYLVVKEGQYFLISSIDNKAYQLNGIGIEPDLSQHLGNGVVAVYGPQVEGSIQAQEIFIDSKLVWESPSKIETNLPRVEGSPN